MGRVGFAVAGVSSLAFLIAFVVIMNDAPGMSFAVAFMLMSLLITAFGFSKSSKWAVSKDAKGAAWAALVLAVLGMMYIAAFYIPWIIPALVWVGLHVVMVAFVVKSPTT